PKRSLFALVGGGSSPAKIYRYSRQMRVARTQCAARYKLDEQQLHLRPLPVRFTGVHDAECDSATLEHDSNESHHSVAGRLIGEMRCVPLGAYRQCTSSLSIKGATSSADEDLCSAGSTIALSCSPEVSVFAMIKGMWESWSVRLPCQAK